MTRPDRLQTPKGAGFKKVFDEFDVNKDGHITSAELKTALKKTRPGSR